MRELLEGTRRNGSGGCRMRVPREKKKKSETEKKAPGQQEEAKERSTSDQVQWNAQGSKEWGRRRDGSQWALIKELQENML